MALPPLPPMPAGITPEWLTAVLQANGTLGADAVITGVSTRGTTTTDTFSLRGFTAAINEARKLCK